MVGLRLARRPRLVPLLVDDYSARRIDPTRTGSRNVKLIDLLSVDIAVTSYSRVRESLNLWFDHKGPTFV